MGGRALPKCEECVKVGKLREHFETTTPGRCRVSWSGLSRRLALVGVQVGRHAPTVRAIRLCLTTAERLMLFVGVARAGGLLVWPWIPRVLVHLSFA